MDDTNDEEKVRRARERDEQREKAGLPPLTDDGIGVVGRYTAGPQSGECPWCSNYSEYLYICNTCGEQRCDRCMPNQHECYGCRRRRENREQDEERRR